MTFKFICCVVSTMLNFYLNSDNWFHIMLTHTWSSNQNTNQIFSFFSFTIYIGDSNINKGDQYHVTKTIVHPNYTTTARWASVTFYDHLFNDVALIKVRDPIQFDDAKVMRACLPNVNQGDTGIRR